MLTPTHVAGSYIACVAWLTFLRRRAKGNIADTSRLLVLGAISGLIPDLDIIYLYWTRGSQVFGDQVGAHHAFITHTPFFYVVVAMTLVAIPWHSSVGKRFVVATVVLVGAISHLILDCVTIGWGVMWLYPISNQLFGWNIVTKLHRYHWGDAWLAHYLSSPFIGAELSLIAVAMLLLRQQSKRGHRDRLAMGRY